MVREPFFLEKCVILESSESSEMFEILDNNNSETYVFKVSVLLSGLLPTLAYVSNSQLKSFRFCFN